jgi:hypothetical protein
MYLHWLPNKKPGTGNQKRLKFYVVSSFLFLVSGSLFAAPKLPPAKLAGLPVEDLQAPYNVQAVVVNHDITLTWAWDPPNPGPQFESFGYEILRGSAVLATVSQTSYTDFGLAVGAHTYQVRVKGGAKEAGRKVAHYSAWSEPAGGTIKMTCGGPPLIQLTVEPTKRMYGSIPALRLHFTGDVKVPAGCTLDHVIYHIDSGVSSERTGPLRVDAKGHFDEFIDAMGAEDEPITGSATFAISVTAKDEAGGTSSGVFNIDLERENPYAPKQG